MPFESVAATEEYDAPEDLFCAVTVTPETGFPDWLSTLPLTTDRPASEHTLGGYTL